MESALKLKKIQGQVLAFSLNEPAAHLSAHVLFTSTSLIGQRNTWNKTGSKRYFSLALAE
jgi:hypothetical protein